MTVRPMFYVEPGAAEELCSTGEAVAFCHSLAADAAEKARQFTPGRDEREAIVSGGAQVADGTASAQVGSMSSIWHIIEFGSINNPPYRPLTRAIEAVGLRFIPE